MRGSRGFLAGVLPLTLFLVGPAVLGGAALSAQASPGVIVGRVTDRAGEPLATVEVRVEGREISTLTGDNGGYRLAGVPPGPVVLTAERLGYATARVELTVPPGGTVVRNIVLAESALELEEITVTADAASRAEGEAATATVIATEAIRHQTATSLAGVLELLPGVEMSPPGLGAIQQVSLRSVRTTGLAGGSSSTDLAAFGTLIIVDGVPLSNNANLQSEGAAADIAFSTSAGGGVDLRQIPASTIERVEVIRGLPSARYGDLTQGAIVVETRAGAFQPEVRAQYDASTTELTFAGGWDVADGQAAVAHLDYARTRSSPGITDDVTERWAGQLTHHYEPRGASGARFMLDSRVNFYRLVDDRPPSENTRPGVRSSARETGLRVSERARWRRDGFTITANGAMTRLWQRSYGAADLVVSAKPFTERTTPGRSEGYFINGQYTSELWVEGDPWLAYGRVELDTEREWPGGHHRVRAGLELRREWNDGAGYIFDMASPPQVTFNGVQGYRRPRSFGSIPGLATSALYVDDRVTGTLPLNIGYDVQLGARLDVLHEGGGWLPRPADVVVQPRLAGELAPWPWLRLRGGWGRTAKVPTLGSFYPAPQYHDVVNVNWYADQPDERLAVLTTSILDPTNDALGFATATKQEAGIEIGLGGSVISLVGFRDRINGGVGIAHEPQYLLRERYELTDSLNGNGVPPEIIEPAAGADTVPVLVRRPTNYIGVTSEGIELMALLPEIPRLRTRVQVQGSWLRTDRRSDRIQFGSLRDFSNFQLSSVKERAPYWEGFHEIAEKHLMTYRVIHHQPDLGLVITAAIQHNLKDSRRDVGSTDTLSWAGYLTRDARLVPVAESDRTQPEYQDLRVPRGGLIEPQSAARDWILGLQVSKALPLNGELRFWAFNALDRPGQYGTAGRQSRLYPRVQFGVEANLSPGSILEAWR
jgi:hypothetical protein